MVFVPSPLIKLVSPHFIQFFSSSMYDTLLKNQCQYLSFSPTLPPAHSPTPYNYNDSLNSAPAVRHNVFGLLAICTLSVIGKTIFTSTNRKPFMLCTQQSSTGYLAFEHYSTHEQKS